MIYGLDLFSGIGGISLALSPWVRTVAYCERDRYAQGVLLSRMREGRIDLAPIWDDIQTLDAGMLPPIDIIYGGFPCQDISTAGNGAGLAGKRSGLFFDVVRLIGGVRPRFVFLENVPAISVRGLDRVLLEFTAMGYHTRWTTVSAAEVGAPHLRERWFLLAYDANRDDENSLSEFCVGAATEPSGGRNVADADSLRKSQRSEKRDRAWDGFIDGGEKVVHSESVGGVERGFTIGASKENTLFDERSKHQGRNLPWAVEPDVGRVAHGIPARLDRIRGLGNAVVPIQAREAFTRLLGIESKEGYAS